MDSVLASLPETDNQASLSRGRLDQLSTEVVRMILLQAHLAHADRLDDVSALERPCPRRIFQSELQ